MMDEPRSLTEANSMNGVVVVFGGSNGTRSSARTVPYAERYAGYNGVYETPVDYLQRAAEDEERRREESTEESRAAGQ